MLRADVNLALHDCPGFANVATAERGIIVCVNEDDHYAAALYILERFTPFELVIARNK